MHTDTDLQSLRQETHDGPERSKNAKKNIYSQPPSHLQKVKKTSVLNGKVSTSIKATWTVNRSSFGQTSSRMGS